MASVKRRASPGRTPGRSGTVLPGASRLGAARIAAALAFVLVSVAACTAPTPTAQPSPSAGPTGQTVTVRTYFFLGSFGASGGLVPVERKVAALEPATATERSAIEALLAGPNDVEFGARPAMYTAVPDGAQLLDLTIADGVAIVNLSGGFAASGNPDAHGSFAQVVFTLTQFETVTAVRFEQDGSPLPVVDDTGAPLDRPVGRADFTARLAPIFVDAPAWGGTLGSPARIYGLANAFEATFHVRILDAAGRSLADGPVMATCGMGCWGTFDVSVPYVVSAAAPGTLQVYELSAMDGSIINLTEYPVTLTP